jgi:hypothetical protein
MKYFEGYTHELIQHMAKGHSFYSFGGVIGCSRELLLKWCDRHKEFEEARKIGHEKALLYWENVQDRASKGQDRANAALIVFRLKNQFRTDYDVDRKVEVTGGVQLIIDTGIDRPEAIEAEGEVKSIEEDLV